MFDILERKSGVDLIERGEYGDPIQYYSIEIFNPNDEDDTTYQINCRSKADAQQLFNLITCNTIAVKT